MSLASMLQEKRLAVFLGPGGVGKTTISAACALAGTTDRSETTARSAKEEAPRK